MADAKSTYLANKVLNYWLKNTADTAPTTVYLALLLSNPTEAGTIVEVSGGSYARQSMSFGTPSASIVATNADINFLSLPVATITFVAIMDAVSGGNMLWYQILNTPIITNLGDQLTFSSGNITVTEL